MQLKFLLSALIVLIGIALWTYLYPRTIETAYIGVMIDNHEDARPYQRGIENAVFVEEQLVEGFLTRFLAIFALNSLPAEVAPVRSVRPYFIDGSAPLVSAIYHVGGSPEALEKLQTSKTVWGFNGIGFDKFFGHDPDAPAPHHRFITKENILALATRITKPRLFSGLPFEYGSFESDESAQHIEINYHNTIQNVAYDYGSWAHSYTKTSDDTVRPPSPANVVIIETDVEVVGPVGRLKVRMDGKGKALLFRDGGVVKGTWRKTGDAAFFTFTDDAGKPFVFREGQIWMIVLDSLERVSWKSL